jgi:hypothetical protein
MNGMLMSLPGSPFLYYGDEIGMGDNIYLGDRNGVRTPMQWSGGWNAGFSSADPERLTQPLISNPCTATRRSTSSRSGGPTTRCSTGPAGCNRCSAAAVPAIRHSLRTMHRISTPYHGVPGKGSALRQIFAAADLLQAGAVAVLDPDVTSVTPEWIEALVRPVRAKQYDFIAPIYARHPLEGPLVSQLVRPLARAAYGWQIAEPQAAEFGCSGRFAAHCLDQPVWDTPLAQVGLDIWLTGEAVSRGFRCAQAPLGPRTVAPGPLRPGLAETFTQVVGSLFACLEQQAPFWLGPQGSEAAAGDRSAADPAGGRAGHRRRAIAAVVRHQPGGPADHSRPFSAPTPTPP